MADCLRQGHAKECVLIRRLGKLIKELRSADYADFRRFKKMRDNKKYTDMLECWNKCKCWDTGIKNN